MEHTPGPWFTKREGFSTVWVEARLRAGVIQEVAACGPTEAGQEQQEANARLIAAAPELLAVVEQFLRPYGVMDKALANTPGPLWDEFLALQKRARVAIENAIG